MWKKFIGCSITLIILFMIVAFGPLRFFWELSFNNQDSLASREYLKAVKSFDSTEIIGEDDLLDRLSIVDTYINEANSSNLYNGSKTDITYDHIITLFNAPNQTIEDVEVAQGDTVYQYAIDNTSLSFHAKEEIINEFYLEETSGDLYDRQALDDIFLTAINNHPNTDSPTSHYTDENYETLVDNAIPTRQVYINGWTFPYFENQFYYDDGQAAYGPEEYVSLNFKTRNNINQLESIHRRFRQPFTKLTNQVYDVDNKEIFQKLLEDFSVEAIENNDYTIRDLEDRLGHPYQLTYNSNEEELTISWYIMPADQTINEVRAIVLLDENRPLESIEDLRSYEITYFDTPPRSSNDRMINTHTYMAQ